MSTPPGARRVIEPQPAISHPATSDQAWHVKHPWGLAAIGMFPLVLFFFFGVTEKGGFGAAPLRVWILFPAWAALWVWFAWYVDPAVRQRRYLRKYPWVEFPTALVERTGMTKIGNVHVRFTDDTGKEFRYQMAPNDDDFTDGTRPIWFAGKPGHNGAVISLRQGACTGMAYTSWVGSARSTTPTRRA